MLDLNDIPVSRPTERLDLGAVVAGLRDAAESWVPQLFPNGRRRGKEWRLANIRGDAPRHTSCVIALDGANAGDWIDFDGGDGGGPISAVEEATGLVDHALFAYAAALAGVAPGAPSRRAPAKLPERRDPSAEIGHILAYSIPIDGTLAAHYLADRRLELPEAPDLLFHPDLTHWESRRGYPALIGRVRNREGEITGVHRTYLDHLPDGRVGKADVASPRMMLGGVAGGAVRLGPLPTSSVAICEGIETGLAVLTVRPDLAVWAALSTAGLEQIDLPASLTEVLILADNDVSGAGERAAEAAARRLCREGRVVTIARPPRVGDDFNDLLLHEGPDAVAAAIVADGGLAGEVTPLPIGQSLPMNYNAPSRPLPTVRADEGDLALAVEKVWALLAASNRRPWIFRYAAIPTWVVPDDEGRPVAVGLTEERLRYMLARLASWCREAAKGKLVAAAPPLALVRSVLATPDPAPPVLLGIVRTPVFGRSGTLLTTPGYHPDAQLLYLPNPGFALPAIPARPSPEQVAAARALICEDLLGDFPFVAPAERAHAVALLLLGFLRGMVDGPTPLHLIEKPTPGTGATLMVDAIATILTGAGASVMTEARDEDEWRKRLTAKLRQIPTLVLVDNLREKLDSAAAAAALTAPFWEDRVLGQSEMARLPIRCLWIATGNNPAVSSEMARRLVRIRLNANVERPWQRGGFRHPDLMTWVRANRPRLVHACLTLCQAWICRRPTPWPAEYWRLRALGPGPRGRAPDGRRRGLPRQPRRDVCGVGHRGRCLAGLRRRMVEQVRHRRGQRRHPLRPRRLLRSGDPALRAQRQGAADESRHGDRQDARPHLRDRAPAPAARKGPGRAPCQHVAPRRRNRAPGCEPVMTSEGDLPAPAGTFGPEVPTANVLRTNAPGNLGNLRNLFPTLTHESYSIITYKEAQKVPTFPRSP